MEHLYQRAIYGDGIALQIETMGATSVAIANRWALGWLDRVKAMLNDKTFIERLKNQTELEKDVFAEVTEMSHLAAHEIRALHGLREAP